MDVKLQRDILSPVVWLSHIGTAERFLIITNKVFVLDRTWLLAVICTATDIKRSFMPLFGAWPSPRIHVLRGSASASRWWSEILGEWHRCWLRKSNGAEFLNVATVLTVMVGAWEIGSFATTQALSLEGNFGQFQTSQSAQTSTISATVIEDSKWWWGVAYLSCFRSVFGALLHSVCLILIWERKEDVDWFETCELTLILVKLKLAFLVFVCVKSEHGKLGKPWQEWEFSQWNDSKTERKTSAVVLPAEAAVLQGCRQVATLRSAAY